MSFYRIEQQGKQVAYRKYVEGGVIHTVRRQITAIFMRNEQSLKNL
jgi:hypothetical protein